MYYDKFMQGTIDVNVGDEFVIKGRHPNKENFPFTFSKNLFELVECSDSYKRECRQNNRFGSSIQWIIWDYTLKALRPGEAEAELKYVVGDGYVLCSDVYKIIVGSN